MKAIFVFSLLLASCWAASAPTEEELAFSANFDEALRNAGLTPRMLETEIVAKIEEFISTIPTFVDYKLINISVINETLVANGHVANMSIAGVEKHTIDNVKFSVLPMQFQMHMLFDDVITAGDYDLDATIAKLVPIYGAGPFSAGAKGTDVFAHVDLASLGGFLYVKAVVFTFAIEGVTFDNALGGDLGIVMTQLIQENAPEYVRRIMYYYGDDIKNAITSVANEFLKDKTINDLIDWIQGKTTAAEAITTASSIFV